MIYDRGWALLRGGLVGLAVFAAIAHAILLAGGEVSRWWLPVCVLGGAGLGVFGALGGGHDANRDLDDARLRSDTSPPRWLVAVAAAVVAVCVLALSYGAVATPARAWDGIVAWELKANALTVAATLQQPFFADPAVWHHSPAYPLLQPMCQAGLAQWCGAAPARLLFPLLYLLFVVIGGLAVVRATQNGRCGLFVGLALATTPFFVNCSGGGADSGYAEMFFAFALCGVAAGMLTGDLVVLGAAVFLLPWIKPEGTIAVVLVPLCCFVASDRRTFWVALAAAALALALWLPVSLELGHRSAVGPLLPAVVAGAALLGAAVRATLDRVGAGVRGRALVCLAGALVAVVVLIVAQPVLERSGSALMQFLGGLDGVADKAAELPAILGGLLRHALMPRRFGLTFLLLVIVGCLWWRARHDTANAPALLGLFGLLGLAAAMVLAAFLLSPEPDVEHHLRSSAPRLLAHWVGVAWVAIGGVWGAERSFAGRPGLNNYPSSN